MTRDRPVTQAVRDWLRAERVVSSLPCFAQPVDYLFGDAIRRSAPVPPVKPPPPVEPIHAVTVAPTSPTALFVGTRLIGQTLKEPLLVPLENLVKHTIIVAGAGSGKTVLIRRIVEEAALLGVPSIVIDGANDLCRLGERWPEPPPDFSPEDRAKSERYASVAEVIVWTPGRQDGNPLILDPLPRFADVVDNADDFQAAIDMARASLAPVAIGKPGVAGKVKLGILAAALRFFGLRGGGSLLELVDLLSELPAEASGGIDNAEKQARGMADAIRAEMQTNPLLRGSGASLDPAALLSTRAPGKVRVSVVNLSGLPDPAAQQQLVNQIAMTLFTWIKKHPARNKALQGLLIVDEARDFVPSMKTVPSKDSLIRLAAQARKYGLGIVFATQAPKSIDHTVIANCSTHFYGRASSPEAASTVQEQLRLRGASGDDVAKLPRGCFYAFTDGLTSALKIQASLCLSHHPPSPPDEREIQVMAVRDRALAR